MHAFLLAVTLLSSVFTAALLPRGVSAHLASFQAATQSPTPMPVFGVQTVTPNPDGSIIHEVLPGQTLFGIAEAYKISITTLAALNNLQTPYTIFPGDKLIIQAQPTPTPTSEATATRQPTLRPTSTQRPPTATPTPTQPPVPTPTPTKAPFLRVPTISMDTRSVGMVIIVVSLLGLVVVGLTSFRKQ